MNKILQIIVSCSIFGNRVVKMVNIIYNNEIDENFLKCNYLSHEPIVENTFLFCTLVVYSGIYVALKSNTIEEHWAKSLWSVYPNVSFSRAGLYAVL